MPPPPLPDRAPAGTASGAAISHARSYRAQRNPSNQQNVSAPDPRTPVSPARAVNRSGGTPRGTIRSQRHPVPDNGKGHAGKRQSSRHRLRDLAGCYFPAARNCLAQSIFPVAINTIIPPSVGTSAVMIQRLNSRELVAFFSISETAICR